MQIYKFNRIKLNFKTLLEMNSTREKLMGLNLTKGIRSTNKVSVIGTGKVGMACAFSLICQVIFLVYI